MTVFVERNTAGVVTGIYAVRQPGNAEEELADDHPDVVSFRNPLPDLAAYAADARWRKETGGVTVAGYQIDTSRESQALINGAFNLAQDDPETVIRFKTGGGFVTLDAATMIVIGRAVGRHVQSCFAREADVVAAVDAGTVTTTAEIDAALEDVTAPWSAA